MKAEEKGSGSVPWSVYGAYIKAAGGPVVFVINIFFFVSTTGSLAFSNWWLSHWIRQGSGVSVDDSIIQDSQWCVFDSQKKNNYCVWMSVTADWALIWMCMIKKVTAPW